jgi:hypothetical protein
VAQRVAFLIGNQTFLPEPESGLPNLQGPTNDVAALASLLADTQRGNFDVRKFLDKPHYEIMREISQALHEAARGDFVLIYYSGHGKLDRSGRLCLATADTEQRALLGTSIRSNNLYDLVDESDCDQVVVLLDCCYSGAVGVGLRGDVSSALHVVNEARGSYTITATTSMQSTRETVARPGVVMGRFTAELVYGIETGAADHERKGKILLSDLRTYLGQVKIGSTPQFYDHSASGDPLISLSPATAGSLLDAEEKTASALWRSAPNEETSQQLLAIIQARAKRMLEYARISPVVGLGDDSAQRLEQFLIKLDAMGWSLRKLTPLAKRLARQGMPEPASKLDGVLKDLATAFETWIEMYEGTMETQSKLQNILSKATPVAIGKDGSEAGFQKS